MIRHGDPSKAKLLGKSTWLSNPWSKFYAGGSCLSSESGWESFFHQKSPTLFATISLIDLETLSVLLFNIKTFTCSHSSCKIGWVWLSSLCTPFPNASCVWCTFDVAQAGYGWTDQAWTSASLEWFLCSERGNLNRSRVDITKMSATYIV